ncbi:MAG: trpS, partial [Bacteroidetes bacterium]|nr:trpS [Bacteroidota bacterium]
MERNPAVKDQVRDLHIENVSYGHLGYPVLQAADILLYKGDLVPVGEDQVPHVEISREIARRFNNQYGNVFPEPEPKLTKFARLPGLDGRRMSKSIGNTILLSDSGDEIKKKMRTAVTDPLKVRKNDPGRPEVCLIFTYHQKFNSTEVPEIDRDCRSGALGCVDCKMRIANRVADVLAPFREKRAHYESHINEVKDTLIDGETRARSRAKATMSEVHQAMSL